MRFEPGGLPRACGLEYVIKSKSRKMTDLSASAVYPAPTRASMDLSPLPLGYRPQRTNMPASDISTAELEATLAARVRHWHCILHTNSSPLAAVRRQLSILSPIRMGMVQDSTLGPSPRRASGLTPPTTTLLGSLTRFAQRTCSAAPLRTLNDWQLVRYSPFFR